MPWPQGNHRPSSAEWASVRATVIRRSGRRCEVVENGIPCGCVGHEVDHVVPVAEGGTDTLANARMICPSHHKPKTQAEARRGAERKRNRGRRPIEQHPFDLM